MDAPDEAVEAAVNRASRASKIEVGHAD